MAPWHSTWNTSICLKLQVLGKLYMYCGCHSAIVSSNFSVMMGMSLRSLTATSLGLICDICVIELKQVFVRELKMCFVNWLSPHVSHVVHSNFRHIHNSNDDVSVQLYLFEINCFISCQLSNEWNSVDITCVYLFLCCHTDMT